MKETAMIEIETNGRACGETCRGYATRNGPNYWGRCMLFGEMLRPVDAEPKPVNAKGAPVFVPVLRCAACLEQNPNAPREPAPAEQPKRGAK